MPPGLTLYNQTTLGNDDFVANFIARHDVLETLLRRLGVAKAEGCGPNQILIGRRGMGKTSLLRRLAIAINRDPSLAARYVPLTFREEQYNVLELGDFWRNCGEALAEWAERADDANLADRLDGALTTKAWAGEDAPAESFAAELAALGRRAVLLVDNLDLILDALSDDDQWVLRRNLQARNGPIMIGAATQPLKESADRSAAFYEFFDPHHLEPLDQHATEECMRALAQGRPPRGDRVVRVLDTQPERLKTLHTLTGGNPRVLALIYGLLETEESDAAMDDLERLLDQVTPFYKARVEDYQTAQQRAVIDAISLNWDPITTGDLSRATKIASTTLSPLLIKLRKDGLIENVGTSGSYAGHQLVERFFNIWYLMRHGTRRTKQKMRWLVGFLTNFYSASELAEIAQRARSGGFGRKLHADYAFALEEAVARQSTVDKTDRRHLSMSVNSPKIEGALGDKKLDEARRLSLQASNLWNAENSIGCIAVLDKLIARFSDAEEPALRTEVAWALINRGLASRQVGDNAAAVDAYDKALARLDDAEDVASRRKVAWALIGKGMALGDGGNRKAEIDILDEVVDRFGDDEAPALQAQVARALVNKGVALGQADDLAAEIAAYDDVMARYGDAKEPILREGVARALCNKSVALGQLGDEAATIAACNDLLARFGEAGDPALREWVARALISKGIALSNVGESTAAIDAYDHVVARFDRAEVPGLQEQVARALFLKGITLGQTGDNTTAITAFENVLARQAVLPKAVVTAARMALGNLLFDVRGDAVSAEAYYLEAASDEPLAANTKLTLLYASADRLPDAIRTRKSFGELPLNEFALLDAAIDLAKDNFGTASDHLMLVFKGKLDSDTIIDGDDVVRLLRLAERKGYGERLIGWFEETGFADRVAPIYVAFKAYVRSEATLLDVNPEVRRPAQVIYDRLDAPRRYQRETAPKPEKPKRRRGRPRKTC